MAIRARQAAKSFEGKPALVGVSLEVADAEALALLGAAGAGKSTLLRALAGRIFLDAGELEVLGHDPIRQDRALFAHVGWVPSQVGFPPGLSVRELGRFCRDVGGCGDALLFAQVCTRLELGSAHLATRLPKNQQFFLSLALALAKSPKLLMLDMPEAGLAAEVRREALFVASEFRPEKCTLVLATEDVREAAEFTKRIVWMKAGRVHESVSAEESVSPEGLAHQLLEKLPAPLPAQNDGALLPSEQLDEASSFVLVHSEKGARS
ncbi:MAG: ATP-binding cassette domain-containing protein [Planctomycetes bacterium]|nr:ATP-binding cassette domain-containing protein [Planctomycetota bacterium]